jgi:hypothetical protein
VPFDEIIIFLINNTLRRVKNLVIPEASMRRTTLLLAGSLIGTGVSIAAHAGTAYPSACCPRYCAPVTKMKWVGSTGRAERRLKVTSNQGTALVPRGLAVRESPDGRAHVCMHYGAFGDLKVTCLLLPPNF